LENESDPVRRRADLKGPKNYIVKLACYNSIATGASELVPPAYDNRRLP